MSETLICLVEDDPIMGESIVERFRLEGFGVDWHTDAAAAYEAIPRKDYAVIVSDVRLPDFPGDELYSRLASTMATVPPFMLVTAYASIDKAVSMLKSGVSDYITKPFDISELVQKIHALSLSAIPDSALPAHGPLGVSPAMRKLAELVPRIARRASSILINGESGSGKEVLARHIHDVASAGQEEPFIAVNCGAVPEALMEAEFFGHERGAFTGAERQKRGFFELAHGGTLFLDEIGDLPLAMQVKLLRVLQEKHVRRVGAERDVACNFRLVCATHRDLNQLVEGRTFREDLFYRLNVVTLRVPPLRERIEDILWIARRFLSAYADANHESPRTLHPAAEAALVTFNWPGNVRELRNRLERACLISNGKVLMPADVFGEDGGDVDERLEDVPTLAAYLDRCETLYISNALVQHNGRIAETAAALGISRKSLWERMRRHRITTQESAGAGSDTAAILKEGGR
ncbi:sigma-54-dependent transcriptional regulator [Burkholderia cepacia]|uniref:Sigma-54-dependent Fis family transcriptional regulator n=1 Tax=Burkholderia cepacia TaxID=292 RepID=A0A8I1B728_BURCE|nr:sigma-54 dependent transcriptional regulator [Burkholderia cepacia]MBA9901211.1 sigma-54-dependent Fis family transcriptional regulator [Burkholderia cepacia]MBA9949705.1 sigma-54-dependent Fis family transcriptional regulator [Burkholderia cepacia]MBA9978756.1 sigma-54-dependent Fis family transcriptional regulator [Burkholderia cepacia]MBA9997745.1 sigma-54-dependent Fis family transcriptional regulator [Burkholderia cepacia]MBB0005104.1 sigma-54-dependent Fis family transcriptional regul